VYQAPCISTYGFWDSIIASPATEKAYFLSTSVPAANINWPGSAFK
jgi:hypothetical protein